MSEWASVSFRSLAGNTEWLGLQGRAHIEPVGELCSQILLCLSSKVVKALNRDSERIDLSFQCAQPIRGWMNEFPPGGNTCRVAISTTHQKHVA